MSPLRFLPTMLATASVAFVADPSAAGVSANGSVVGSGAPNVMTSPNGTPIGVADEFETVQDTRLVVDAPGVLANDSDPDGDPISFGFSSIPANGTLFGFLDDGAFTYEPDPGFVGVDTFLYSVQDDQGNFTGATVPVTITVTAAPDPTTTTDPPNDPPIGINDAFEVVENTSLNVAAPGVLANDSDPDGDPIEVTGTIQPANGLVQMSPQGSFAYTPDPGFAGLDSFLYEVSDDQGNSTGLVVEVVITVTPESADPPDSEPNSPPIGVDDAFEVVEGTMLVVAAPGLLANDSDPDGDPISVPSASIPDNGSLSGQQVGSFQYTPDPGFTGVDSFRYAVEDDQGNSTGVVVDVVVTVIAAPDPATTTTEPVVPTTAGEAADPTPETDPATPTDPTTPTEPDNTDSAPVAEQTGSVLAGTDGPAGVLRAAGSTSGPAITTTTLPGTLPVTGVGPIALGLSALLVAAGAGVTALGTIATHGARRAGRGHHVRRR